jgi:hypothetical protein
MRVYSYRRVSVWGMAVTLPLVAACGKSPGESCREDSECGASLVCTFPKVDGGAAEKGICAPQLSKEGEVCTSNASCASGLFCSTDLPSEVSKPDGVCIPRLPEGHACFRDADCQARLKCLEDPAGHLVCTAPLGPDAGSVDSGGSSEVTTAAVDSRPGPLDSAGVMD